ncbi:unnamed protein product [Parnassius apollo]|uniref:(apollo) hypothetical protein n=1 Tax=Parnassius apollo TaxID=110799 RepID=A0A8S3XQ43_PARAO|nr:unnamed protein product [Parnassius apollo]
MHRQIQSAHFGTQNQISLHTSVIYVKSSKPRAYCTLSDSTDHSPAAIWAHLRPILIDIKKKVPQINSVHVFSDGPAIQYKQKKNFYLYKLYLEDLNFEKGTWNFSESYHGKSAADGIGGVIKRLLDAKVSHGMDVSDTSTAYSLLKENTTVQKIQHLFCVDESDIIEIKSKNQTAFESLVPVPKTMKIHQIQVETENHSNEINYRVLSCFCNGSSMRGFCESFNIKRHCLLKSRPRKRTRLTSDSDDCLPLPFKRTAHTTNMSAAISKSENKTPPVSLKNIPTVPIDIFGAVDCDSDSSDIFDLPRTIGTTKTSKRKVRSNPTQIMTPVVAGHTYATVTNKENVDHQYKNNWKNIKNAGAVTILSDVKVNYAISDLRKMISNTKRQNVSSCNLKVDFPKILESSTTNSVSLKNFFL